MHELSIAEAIVTIAERHAAGRQVYRVSVKVGHLRQVVPDALRFAFQLLTDGTVLEGAELAIEEVPARVRCRGCGAQTRARGFPLSCAECRGVDVEVCAGEELLVDELDVEEAMAIEGMAHGG
jgi:hydrogenase nickel incorporation protein HypA/HybF